MPLLLICVPDESLLCLLHPIHNKLTSKSPIIFLMVEFSTSGIKIALSGWLTFNEGKFISKYGVFFKLDLWLVIPYYRNFTLIIHSFTVERTLGLGKVGSAGPLSVFGWASWIGTFFVISATGSFAKWLVGGHVDFKSMSAISMPQHQERRTTHQPFSKLKPVAEITKKVPIHEAHPNTERGPALPDLPQPSVLSTVNEVK